MRASIVYSVASSKDKMINVRLTPVVHEQFKIACDLRGGSMSSLLHQFIVRTIREERELDPKAFELIQSDHTKKTKQLKTGAPASANHTDIPVGKEVPPYSSHPISVGDTPQAKKRRTG